MDTVEWVSPSGRFTQFSVTDLWKANNVSMSKDYRHVVVLSTSNGVSVLDHRYLINTFAENVSKDALVSEEKKASVTTVGVCQANPDEDAKWLTLHAQVLTSEELKAIYFDINEYDDSFDRLINTLLRHHSKLHFIHISIT